MHPELTFQIANQRIHDLRREGELQRTFRELRASRAGSTRRRWLRRPLPRPVLSRPGQTSA